MTKSWSEFGHIPLSFIPHSSYYFALFSRIPIIPIRVSPVTAHVSRGSESLAFFSFMKRNNRVNSSKRFSSNQLSNHVTFQNKTSTSETRKVLRGLFSCGKFELIQKTPKICLPNPLRPSIKLKILLCVSIHLLQT